MRSLVHPDDPYTYTEEAFVPDEQRDYMAFRVYRRGAQIDTVTYLSEFTSDDVREQLIKRDGYPHDIVVRRGA